MIAFKCGGCAMVHRVEERCRGLRARCRECGTEIVVPDESDPQFAEPVAQQMEADSDESALADTLPPATPKELEASGNGSQKKTAKRMAAVKPESATQPAVAVTAPEPTSDTSTPELDDDAIVEEEDEDLVAEAPDVGIPLAAPTVTPKVEPEAPSAEEDELEKIDDDEEDLEEEAGKESQEDEEAEGRPLWQGVWQKLKPWQRYAALGGCLAILLTLGSIVYTMFFSGSTPGPAPKGNQQASNPPAKETPIAQAPPPKTEPTQTKGETSTAMAKKPLDKKEDKKEPGKEDVPPVEPPPEEEKALWITATRLIQDYAANPAETDRRYAGKTMEVAGVFDRLDLALLTREAPQPCVTIGDGGKGSISCSVNYTFSPPEVWKKLRSGQPITVRAQYEPKCRLHRCELLLTQAPADADFRYKRIEVTGVIEQVKPRDPESGFKSLRLESPFTDSPLFIDCAFRVSDEKQLDNADAGQLITLRGNVGGRTGRVLRLNNCEIVHPNTPAERVIAIPFRKLAMEYERDLLAEPRSEDNLPYRSTTAPQLVGEFEEGIDKAVRKYHQKRLVISGTVESRTPGDRRIVFESDTDQKLRVVCQFTVLDYGKVPPEPRLTIEGVFGGVEGRQIRFENCSVADPSKRPGQEQRLTADFLPYRTGETIAYDVAWITSGSNNKIQRRTLTFGPDHVMEIKTVRTGVLKASSLWAPGEHIFWNPETLGVKGGELHYRVSGPVIEIGQLIPAANAVMYEPALKTGIKPGDVWTWRSPLEQEVIYMFVGFGQHRRRPAVLIKKVERFKGQALETESLHIYVKGVGEVERRVYSTIPGRAYKQPTSETRLVDNEPEEKDDEVKLPPPKAKTPEGKKVEEKKADEKSSPKVAPAGQGAGALKPAEAPARSATLRESLSEPTSFRPRFHSRPRVDDTLTAGSSG